MKKNNNNKSETYMFSTIKLTTYVYPTEDLKTIEKALWNLLPDQLKHKNKGVASKNLEVTQEHLQLIDRSPLVRVILKLKKKSDVQAFMVNFVQRINLFDQQTILERIPLSLSTKGILHIRLDKQEAVSSRIKLLPQRDANIIPPKGEPGHAIQLKIKFKRKFVKGRKPTKKSSAINTSNVVELLRSVGLQK